MKRTVTFSLADCYFQSTLLHKHHSHTAASFFFFFFFRHFIWLRNFSLFFLDFAIDFLIHFLSAILFSSHNNFHDLFLVILYLFQVYRYSLSWNSQFFSCNLLVFISQHSLPFLITLSLSPTNPPEPSTQVNAASLNTFPCILYSPFRYTFEPTGFPYTLSECIPWFAYL